MSKSASPIGFYSQLRRYLTTPTDTPEQKDKVLKAASSSVPNISWAVSTEKLSSLHFELRHPGGPSAETTELIRCAFADLTVLKGRAAQAVFKKLEKILKVSPGIIVYKTKPKRAGRTFLLHVSHPGSFNKILPTGIGSLETGLFIPVAS